MYLNINKVEYIIITIIAILIVIITITYSYSEFTRIMIRGVKGWRG